MNARIALLMTLVSGATSAMANDDEPSFQPRHITALRMMGSAAGDSVFGARAANEVDYYSNVDIGPGSYVFYSSGTHAAGEPLYFERGGINAAGNPVGPVASSSKIGTVEFWVIAEEPGAAATVDCTVTIEMFEHTTEWIAYGGTDNPDCDGSVGRISLGGFRVDLIGANAPTNHTANGYIVDLGSQNLAWTMPDGNGFIDMRCWPPSFANTPNYVYPAFNGAADMCSYAPGAYPALGYSADNFYFDADQSGTYKNNERFNFGGLPYLANLMIRLSGNDGCSFDLDGSGFVNGDDVDYAFELLTAGCPY